MAQSKDGSGANGAAMTSYRAGAEGVSEAGRRGRVWPDRIGSRCRRATSSGGGGGGGGGCCRRW